MVSLKVKKTNEVKVLLKSGKYSVFSTLDGHTILEPKSNFGQDYWDIEDAVKHSCIPINKIENYWAVV